MRASGAKRKFKAISLSLRLQPAGIKLQEILSNADKESNEKSHRKDGVQSENWFTSHKFFYVLFSVTKSFLLGFSWSSDIVPASN